MSIGVLAASAVIVCDCTRRHRVARRARLPRHPPSVEDGCRMTTDWNPVLRSEFAKPYWQDLQAFVRTERERTVVYPPHDEVFAALHPTPYATTRC